MMIWRSGINAKCDYFNETWLRFRGRTLDQELGDGWTEGVHPDDLARCLDIYLSHFGRREAFTMEYRLRRHDGTYRWLRDAGVPFADGTGRFGGFIGSCLDVQERHEADHARGLFLGTIAEELAQPVTGLSTLVSWLQREVKEGGTVDELLIERIVHRVQRLDGLVAEFSDAARHEQGTPHVLDRHREDLEPLVRRIVETRAHILTVFEDDSVRCDLRLAVEAGDHQALVDARRIEQMLNQLLDNAVKYSRAGGQIGVTLSSQAGEVHLTVTDAGIGIPPAEVPHVTRRYYRASNAPAADLPGIGLGLAIVDELCRAHGGRLDVASTLGRGTTVTITLPALHA